MINPLQIRESFFVFSTDFHEMDEQLLSQGELRELIVETRPISTRAALKGSVSIRDDDSLSVVCHPRLHSHSP